VNQHLKKSYYVRRRDKVFGPFSSSQISSGKATNKYQATDLISESSDGPWIEISRHFAVQEASGAQAPTTPPINANNVLTPKEEVGVAAPAAKPASSNWKYAALAIAGILGVGAIGVLGLFVLIVILALGSSKGEPAAPTSAVEGDAIVSSAAPEDDNSADEAVKVLTELNKALAGMNQQANEGAGPTANSDVAPEDFSELSEELQALSAKDATETAMKMLSPSQREGDGRTARLLLNKAASEGDGGAMYFLFLCYYKGWGGEVDEAKGLAWLRKSAEAGDLSGMYAFSTAIRKGWYEGLGEAEGLAWLERSANAGHAGAMNEIKREKVAGVLGGVLGALESMPESDEGGSESKSACRHGPFGGFSDEHELCRCPGYEPGGGATEVEQRTGRYCRNCNHEQSWHSR
jgi:hypothetical protein